MQSLSVVNLIVLVAYLLVSGSIQEGSDVCYPGLGCFRENGTFKDVVVLLPQPPQKVRTKFYLFSRQNSRKGIVLDYADRSTLITKHLQVHRNTYILVHGYMDRGSNAGGIARMKRALLEYSNCQVITVDWRGGSNNVYWQSVVNAELTGRQIARLLEVLWMQRALEPSSVHLVGFSLGAHVAGFAGKWARDGIGFLIGRITGLDPASPLFEGRGPGVHLWKHDATFVDVIHTSAGQDLLRGKLGMLQAVGHVDFYPNGGTDQPGCQNKSKTCCHIRAEDLFVESITSLGNCFFSSVPCPGGHESFLRGQCMDCGEQGCGWMGLPSQTAPGRGVQLLVTESEAPYCKLTIPD